ncbi:hypothetical protein Cs7R123_06460 [Catellatospora sp. TT07R-123]|uniref:hypothetical protein n=1 Tax=Catellatospora sp. TT07R-123 TaxID=2733863 RepID=UPI001B2C40FE|nr:hypothetical protein [Catellatospora sp. TT07R-123]GHJ43304.1 hypothetical protein Cs7R123_06460 [Catellatospora sp. TT07R-123]
MTATPTRPAPLRVVSYGGGVQSTALLVLAAQRVIDFPVFLFANVGDDSEDPDTMTYLHQYARPFAALHGIQLHVLDKRRRDGSIETLYGRLTRHGSRSLPIPVRMSNGAPGTRSCTAEFKIRVIGKWLRQHGASPGNKATVGIGISLDEIERLNNRKATPYEIPVYPCSTRRARCGASTAGASSPTPDYRCRQSRPAGSVR